MRPILFHLVLSCTIASAQPATKFELLDVFDLEYVSDPRISPDGSRIIYVRNFKDIMTDQNFSNLWIVNFDGSMHRPLTTGNHKDFAPRWSNDGKKIVYKSGRDGKVQAYLKWLDSGAETKLTNTPETPGDLLWSPDDRFLAFSMFVPQSKGSPIKLPAKPEGAKWNDPPKYIDKLNYRADGQGYLKEGHTQLFVLSADGGTPRQVTKGDFDHGTPVWTKDGRSLIFSANLREGGEYEPRNSEVYRVFTTDGKIEVLTHRKGPDFSPRISPSGDRIAYLGFDDRFQGYQITELYVMNPDGSESQLISGGLDRDVQNIQWSKDGKGLYFQYDDQGDTKLAWMSLGGKVTVLASQVGGLSLGRPYDGGTFTVAINGRYAYTLGATDHPADLGVGEKGSSRRLTRLNDDLFGHKKLGEVEEVWYESSHDKTRIQGWVVKPPDFDPGKKYPLILEIHGGPFANYGSRFSSEVQLYAARGYVVLYTNPRGSTSYGEKFGNAIHHSYPGYDYDDLMSGVDALIAKGYIDENNLFVTGGSGGGVLTSWIVGKTDRFRAAVVAKPVINWYSFVLYADGPAFFYRYWFPGLPWENPQNYLDRSPISLVGNVKTPTMLLTGEEDYRTPIAESEQYYAALKLQKVESALVRIPGASHGIAARPSNLIGKLAAVLSWFEKYKQKEPEVE